MKRNLIIAIGIGIVIIVIALFAKQKNEPSKISEKVQKIEPATVPEYKAPVYIPNRNPDVKIEIDQIWITATSDEKGDRSLYLKIRNKGSLADLLIAAWTPRAAQTQLHEATGNHSSQPVKEIKIEPKSNILLQAGSYQIKLIKLDPTLKEGDEIEFRLMFVEYGEVKLQVPILEHLAMSLDPTVNDGTSDSKGKLPNNPNVK